MDVEVVDPEGTGECRESRTSAMLLPAAPKGRGQVGARTRTITAGALVLVGLAVVCAFGGRFLVAQLRERQGQPLASAWDRQTGATQTLEGYRVLAVEKEGAFAWVVKDPGHTIPGVKTLSVDERKISFLGMSVADTASDFSRHWLLTRSAGPRT